MSAELLPSGGTALPGHPQSYRLSTPNTASSPRVCRETVAVLLEACGHAGLVDVAKVLVSEVVTNVNLHTRSAVVHLEATVHGDRVLVSVGDDEPDGHPWVRQPCPDEERGRGLLLLRELSQRWGVTWIGGLEPAGKRIWFELFAQAA